MFVADNLFRSGADNSKLFSPHKNEDIYSPWSQEVQNFKKSIPNRAHRKGLVSEHRYPSQLQNYTNKSKDLMEANRRRMNILTEKSVTIEYDEQPLVASRHDSEANRIKLPLLPLKKLSRHVSPKKALHVEDSRQITRKSKSNQKYIPKIHAENHPHLQIYKRMLDAARKDIKNAKKNPQK